MTQPIITSVFIGHNAIIIDGIDYAKIGGKIEYIIHNNDNTYNIQISYPIYDELEFLTPDIYIKRFPILASSDTDLHKVGTYYLTINHMKLEK